EAQQEIAERLEKHDAPRPPQIIPPVRLGEKESAGAKFVPVMYPGEIVAPGVVSILGAEVVAERSENPKAAQRPEHGGFGRLIEKRVGRCHAERRRRWRAVPVRSLNRTSKAHPGFVHHR